MTIKKGFSPPKTVTIDVKEVGLLLDTILQHRGPHSRNTWKRLLANGRILVDGRIVKKYDFRLAVGQIITVDPILLPPKKPLQQKHLTILFEDEWYVAINKPAGLLSIATEKEKDRTAYHLLRNQLQATAPYLKLFVLHRLDRETSGVLVFAKSESAKHMLQDQWQALVTRRAYLALVEGTVEPTKGTWQSYLKENKEGEVYLSSEQEEGAKLAVTHYEVVQQGTSYALLECLLETGRKNQIRVQAAAAKHPMVGDRKYGTRQNPMQRLGLHASSLMFTHPYTKEQVSIVTEMPHSFRSLLGITLAKGELK